MSKTEKEKSAKGRSESYLLLSLFLLNLVACTSETRKDLLAEGGQSHHAKVPSVPENWPKSFGFGRNANPAQIAALDIDVRPDGKGLPAGSGNVLSGKAIYAAKCAACHGATGTEGPYDPLVATSESKKGKDKTIGTYWPYATTLYDYINRAMPFNAPGSLTPDEVYGLTAYLLAANHLISEKTVLDAQTLPQVKMPALTRYVPDDRRGGKEVR